MQIGTIDHFYQYYVPMGRVQQNSGWLMFFYDDNAYLCKSWQLLAVFAILRFGKASSLKIYGCKIYFQSALQKCESLRESLRCRLQSWQSLRKNCQSQLQNWRTLRQKINCRRKSCRRRQQNCQSLRKNWRNQLQSWRSLRQKSFGVGNIVMGIGNIAISIGNIVMGMDNFEIDLRKKINAWIKIFKWNRAAILFLGLRWTTCKKTYSSIL